MIKVGVIGATGYAGIELVRLLLGHPSVEITALSSVSFEGKPISQIYPSLAGLCDTTLVTEADVLSQCDVVFASLPHGLSQDTAATCFAAGKLFIDLGADFRLHAEEDYTAWYGGTFSDHKLHQHAVYAIPELFRREIADAKLIANPGCYPTCASLGLAPLLKNQLIHPKSIIIDAKSGVTGAGRSPTQTTHFPDCDEAFSPYKIAEHRHIPEIEQTLSTLRGDDVTITFVPHLLPVNRGILSTIYAAPVSGLPMDKLHALYSDFYRDERFVRVMPAGEIANIRNVRCSNYCDISLHTDPRAGRVIVVSVIDNMVKGAAGQAVQNMNIALALPEAAGLTAVPTPF